jgi:hypothetical protein
MKTKDYIQVVGFIDQTLINIADGDSGGELDPHGADLRGNPLGGLVYSNGFPSNNGNNDSYQQVIEWHNFMGGNQFCFKTCDPAGANAANFCQHIYDRIGCAYNAPNAAQNGTFEVCEGENQDFPGVYTGANNVVTTYAQPAESLGVITSMPYTARIPASSNCVQYQSADLYKDLVAAFPTSALPPKPTATGSATGSQSGSSNPASKSSGGSSPSQTANAAAGLRRGGEEGVLLGAVIGLLGVMGSIALLA